MIKNDHSDIAQELWTTIALNETVLPSDTVAVSPEIYRIILEELESPQKKKKVGSVELVRSQRGDSVAEGRRAKFEAYRRRTQ